MPDLLTFLKTECRGKDRAVKVRNLAFMFHVTQRELRDQLRQLNLSGEPIVSGPGGIYIATEPQDIDRYWHNLNSRVLKLLERMRAISKTKTREFIGKQMELFG